MAQDTNMALSKQLDALIHDKNAIVTYKTVSRRLSLPVNAAKQFLNEYLNSWRNSSKKGLSALYYVTGISTLEDGSLEQQAVVAREADVAEWEKKLRNTEKHVYSVCLVDYEDNQAIYAADNPPTVEEVCCLLAKTSITCPTVKFKSQQISSQPIISEPNIVTATGITSLENSSRKIMSAIGVTVEALRLKSLSSDVLPEAPNTDIPKAASAKSNIASWIKSGGMDLKKSVPVKSLLNQKQAERLQSETVNGESDDEECFVSSKKTLNSRAKVPMKFDDDEDGTRPVLVDLSEDNSVPSQKTVVSMEEKTRERRSSSPDEPVMIRRRTFNKSEGSQRSEKLTPGVTKNGRLSPTDLTQVSSNESDDEPVVFKSQTHGPRSTVKRSFESDSDCSETHQPAVEDKYGFPVMEEDAEVSGSEMANGTSSKKKAKPWRNKPNTSKDDYSHDRPDSQKKSRKPRKKAKGPCSDEEDRRERSPSVMVEDDAEEHTDSQKKARKPRRKAKRPDSDQDDDRARSLSQEKPEPLRQFLVTPTPPVSSGRRRKQVNQTTKDDEGYDVVKKIWVEINSDEEIELENTDTVASATDDTKRKNTAVSGSEKAFGVKKVEAVAKKPSKPIPKGKGVQSSIMSFFKKA